MTALKSSSRRPTRNSPSHEDDITAAPPDKLDRLFDELSHMNETLQNVATDVATIKLTTTELTAAVASMQGRMDEAEARIMYLEEVSEQWRSEKVSKDRDMEALWNRVQVLENQSRRNNVRLLGLKETIGTSGTLLDCVQKILSEGLGMPLDEDMVIERVHRQLGPAPNPDQPPRPVLIRFLRQSTRDKVVNLAKEKRGCNYGGCQLSLFPDMSKELAQKRKAFTPVKRKLQQLDIRYSLAFPATLHFKWRGKGVSFNSAAEAAKFIEDHQP